MDSTELSELAFLRDISLTFKLEPLDSTGHAASVDDVIRVLTGIKESFKSYIKFKINKDNVVLKSNDTIEEFSNLTELLIVDTKFNSFETSIAPNLKDMSFALFNENEAKSINTYFQEYKQDVIYKDLNIYHELLQLKDIFTDQERENIFYPLISASSSKKYNLFVWDKNNSRKRLVKPQKEYQVYFKERKEKKVKPKEKYYQFYATVSESGDTIKKTNIKDIIYFEKLEHETYPFKPQLISYNKYTFKLKNKLECLVTFEDDLYYIENELLNITVWGQSRDEVENAFYFEFYSLYINYVLEEDINLTDKAIALKNDILNLIDVVYEK